MIPWTVLIREAKGHDCVGDTEFLVVLGEEGILYSLFIHLDGAYLSILPSFLHCILYLSELAFYFTRNKQKLHHLWERKGGGVGYIQRENKFRFCCCVTPENFWPAHVRFCSWKKIFKNSSIVWAVESYNHLAPPSEEAACLSGKAMDPGWPL